MEITPKSFGDALNEWFRSLGRNWKVLLLSSLVVHVPLAVIVAVLFLATGAADSLALSLDPEALETMTNEELIDTLSPLAPAAGAWLILQLIATVFVYLAASRAVAGDLAGTGLPANAVSRFAARRTVVGVAAAFVVLVGTVVLVALATAFGWVVFAMGGVGFITVFLTATAALTILVVLVWLGVSVSLAAQAIAMEGTGAVRALARSFNLVQSRWWVTLGFLLIVTIIASAASQLVSLPLTPLFLIGVNTPEVLAVVLGISTLLQGPLLAATGAAYAIWYADLRSRNETLTAEQLL